MDDSPFLLTQISSSPPPAISSIESDCVYWQSSQSSCAALDALMVDAARAYRPSNDASTTPRRISSSSSTNKLDHSPTFPPPPNKRQRPYAHPSFASSSSAPAPPAHPHPRSRRTTSRHTQHAPVHSTPTSSSKTKAGVVDVNPVSSSLPSPRTFLALVKGVSRRVDGRLKKEEGSGELEGRVSAATKKVTRSVPSTRTATATASSRFRRTPSAGAVVQTASSTTTATSAQDRFESQVFTQTQTQAPSQSQTQSQTRLSQTRVRTQTQIPTTQSPPRIHAATGSRAREPLSRTPSQLSMPPPPLPIDEGSTSKGITSSQLPNPSQSDMTRMSKPSTRPPVLGMRRAPTLFLASKPSVTARRVFKPPLLQNKGKEKGEEGRGQGNKGTSSSYVRDEGRERKREEAPRWKGDDARISDDGDTDDGGSPSPTSKRCPKEEDKKETMKLEVEADGESEGDSSFGELSFDVDMDALEEVMRAYD